ncbi:MAG: hypothetical protein QOH23_133 [Gaiellaceae bacterium]|nr:hypothetical protein [Gaiellaceae bacterium]
MAALGLTGCAGGSEHRAAPPPKLPPALGSDLAAQSDRVAQALDAGDGCRAAALAKTLQHQTIAAINAHRVPTPLQEDLAASVTDLVSRIQCVPVQQPQDRGKHKGKDKKKHKGKRDD